MPKVKEDSKYKKLYNEEIISKALEDILNNGTSKKAASKKYGIPRSTLQFRLSRKFTKTTLGPNPVLSKEEEQILVDWVLQSHKKGFPRRKEDLQVSVKSFLDEKPRDNPFKDNMPGDGWYKAFLRRHPLLCERVPEAVTAASSKVSEADIRKWFKDIETYLKEEHYYEILECPDRVFNADETCFMLCPKNKTVIAPKGARNVYEIDNAPAKSNLTVLFTLSAEGKVTPPFIIYPYKRLPASITASVPDSWGIGISSNGWMKAELFFEYIANVFYPSLVRDGTKFPVILFVDGHSTHTSYQLSDLCSQLNIILICLYANSTRILQPADVSTFKPLKSYWKKGVLDWRRQHNSEALTQDKFAPVLKEVIETYMKPEIIRNGFITTGLCPWNPNVIDYSKCLGKMKTAIKSKDPDVSVMHYSRFKEIVGDTLMNKIQTVDQMSTQESDEFWALHKLWKDYCSPLQNDLDINTANLENYSNNSNKSTNDSVIIELDKNVQIINITDEIFNIEEMPIIIDPSVLGTPVSETLLTTIPAVTETADITIDTSKEMSQPRDLLNLSNSSITDYLSWPESPASKGERNVERMPFVLTSKQWKKQQEEKRDKKIYEERQKEERKRIRIEKKEEKEMKQLDKKKCTKRLKNTKNATNKKNSSELLVKNTDEESKENVFDGNTEKQTISAKNWNKNINVISNIQLNNAVESVKRVLFRPETDENSDDPNLQEIRGNLIKSGLCYSCVKNIHDNYYGYRCSTCSRTYHKNCIQKHNLFDISVDKSFTCRTCKTKKLVH